jgi:hypothetical protein
MADPQMDDEERLIFLLLSRYLDKKVSSSYVGTRYSELRSSIGAQSSEVAELLAEIRRLRERVDDAERRFVTELRGSEERMLLSNLKIEAILSESDAFADELMQRVVPIYFYLQESDNLFQSDGDPGPSKVRAALWLVLSELEIPVALNEPGAVTFSWLERIWGKTTEVLTKPEVQEKLSKVERAIELQQIDAHQAQVDLGLSKAVKELIKALEGVDVGIISIGSLFVVKTKQKGQTKIGVISLTQEQMKLVKQNPAMQVDPKFFLELISAQKKLAS